MAVRSGTLRLRTDGDGEVVDLTEGVASIVRASGMETGVAVVFVTGSTAAVTTIEHEPGIVHDLRAVLDTLLPAGADYEHNRRNRDSNAHAHLRASIIGASQSIPLVDGDLRLGTWQQVVLIDFDDRPRERTVTVQILA